MRRVQVLLVALGLSLGAFVALLAWYLYGYQSGRVSISGMMGQMTGAQYGSSAMTAMPGYVWGSLLALAVAIAVAIGGVGFYLVAPEIKTEAAPEGEEPRVPVAPVHHQESWSALLRSSKPEERKVLEVLATHNGTHLQKFIVKESGLSRLKTHRIIARFSERGIVRAVKSGNTNEISLADWLTRPESYPKQ